VTRLNKLSFGFYNLKIPPKEIKEESEKELDREGAENSIN